LLGSARRAAETLVAPEAVPTGRRFVVRHADGRGIEYLQLAEL